MAGGVGCPAQRLGAEERDFGNAQSTCRLHVPDKRGDELGATGRAERLSVVDGIAEAEEHRLVDERLQPVAVNRGDEQVNRVRAEIDGRPEARLADPTDWRDWSRQDGPVPSPDPSAGAAFRVRAVRVAGVDAVFRRVDADVVDARALDVTATFGFAAAGFAAAGFAAAGFAAAGFAAGTATDRARVGAGRSALTWAVSWATSARASDACFFRFASTSRAF